MKKIMIDSSTQNQRLDKFLRRYLPNAGSGFLYRMLREKKIKRNGGRAQGNELLQAGDEITIFFSDETLAKFMGTAAEQEAAQSPETKAEKAGAALFQKHILYEDRNVVILNKPAGMLSQRDAKNNMSACEYLVSYLMETGKRTQEDLRIYRPSAVNRLDRNTSGLLVCAASLPAAQKLSELFKSRGLKKEYLALVKGHVETARELKGFLRKDAKTNRVTIRETFAEGYEKIETAYAPAGYFENMTLLCVDLKTGKPHQIRAALAAEGHPIAGDEKYGEAAFNRKLRERFGLRRQFLHAYRLTFPKLEGVLAALSETCITAPLPKELQAIEKEIKRG